VAQSISLTQLDARKASETEFEFEYLIDGAETGIFFSVIGGQAKRVTDAITRLINGQRRRAAVAELKAKSGGQKEEAVFTPFEEDVEFSNQSAALRLTGWRGITEDFSPELALSLCESNADIRQKVLDQSNKIGNFIRLSPPTS
jgi:hypothetical protein